MASVTLPSTPGPSRAVPSLVDFSGTLRGALGGATQIVNRLGTRWSLSVTMPPMIMEDARAWSAALVKARREGVLWPMRQVDIGVGSPGAPLVNGTAQFGSSLVVDGLSADYAYQLGQFFSVITDSRRYLYQVSADGVADGAGDATIPVEPLLRTSPNDNDIVEFSTPYIEGALTDVPSWILDVDRVARGFSFTIEELR